MKWLRNILKGISLTGALFVFQACYGTPQSSMYGEAGQAPMSFSLVSKDNGSPLEGIRISSSLSEQAYDSLELGVTGPDGKCDVVIPYLRNLEGPVVSFEDPDGKFILKDTTLTDLREREILIQLTST